MKGNLCYLWKSLESYMLFIVIFLLFIKKSVEATRFLCLYYQYALIV